jgi:hypothetical protein
VTFNGQCQHELNGDGDAIVEPGEGMDLTVTLKNTGTQGLTSLQGQLSSVDPYVTVTQASSAWPDLSPNTSGANTTAYLISVSAGCPPLHFIPLSLHVTGTGLDTTLAIYASVGFAGLADNVESGVQGWTTGGSNNLWHITTRRANSATHSWFSGNDVGSYNDNMNCYLLTDTLTLGPNTDLSYYQWYDLETGYDYGYVEMNTGSGWVQLGSTVNGTSGSWIHTTVSLGLTCPGTLVQVRFRMTSDGGVTNEGWYVDDIQIAQPPPPPNIFVTPTALSVAILPGAVETRQVLVQNTGISDLNYTTGFTTGATADTSGPDAFGYRWQSSTGPCGPTYQWLPIGSSGTQITFLTTEGDAVKGPYQLGFTVPFYGMNYTRIWVSANGWISFADSTTTNYINTSLPNSGAPAGAICGWWDDLKPQLAGTNVRFWTNGVDSAAVHYENVRAGTSPNQGTYNFQILITKYGDAKVFYGNMGTIRLNSSTVGIQNATKTTGIVYLYNQLGITNNSAVRFAMGPRWVAILPAAGAVPGGQTATLLAYFFGGLLCNDPGATVLNVRSNDPDSPIVPVSIGITTQVTPDTPTGLVIRMVGNDLVLMWAHANNATGYVIERATSPDGPYLPYGTSVTESFTDTNAVNEPGPLFYHVIATNGVVGATRLSR